MDATTKTPLQSLTIVSALWALLFVVLKLIGIEPPAEIAAHVSPAVAAIVTTFAPLVLVIYGRIRATKRIV